MLSFHKSHNYSAYLSQKSHSPCSDLTNVTLTMLSYHFDASKGAIVFSNSIKSECYKCMHACTCTYYYASCNGASLSSTHCTCTCICTVMVMYIPYRSVFAGRTVSASYSAITPAKAQALQGNWTYVSVYREWLVNFPGFCENLKGEFFIFLNFLVNRYQEHCK